LSKPNILIVAATRTAIGSFGGSLKDVPLSQLAILAVKSAMDRGGVDPQAVGHLVMGNVLVNEPRDVYLGRIAAIEAGLPPEVPAYRRSSWLPRRFHSDQPRLLKGSIPILVDGQCIGAVGVSGVEPEQDAQVARAEVAPILT
jgi:hypothetical protein